VDLGEDYFAYAATWTRDSSRVIISANTIGVYLAPAAGGAAARLMPYPSPTVALGDIALSPDGRQVAVTTQYSAQARHLQTHLIDLETGRVRSVQLKPLDDGRPYGHGVLAIGFRPNGQIVQAGYGGLRIWNPALSTLTWLREDPALTCRMAVVSRQDVAFAVCSSDKTGAARWMEDGQLSAINLEDGAAVPLPRYGTRLTGAGAVDDGGRFVATGDNDGVVRVGRIDGGEPHLLPGHGGPVQRVAISPDGRWVASSNGTDIRLWPMPDLDQTPFHLLPYPELMDCLNRATNLRVVEDPSAAKGYRLELAPFTGWSDYPDW
jgi:WD40 repeat protein